MAKAPSRSARSGAVVPAPTGPGTRARLPLPGRLRRQLRGGRQSPLPLSARHKGSTPRPTKKAGTLQPPAGSGRPARPAPVAHLRAQGGAHLPEGQPEVLGHPEVAPLPELLQRRKGALRDRLRPGRVRQAPVRQPERLPQVQRVLAVVPCGKKEGEEGREGDGYLAATMRSMSAISASSTLRPTPLPLLLPLPGLTRVLGRHDALHVGNLRVQHAAPAGRIPQQAVRDQAIKGVQVALGGYQRAG